MSDEIKINPSEKGQPKFRNAISEDLQTPLPPPFHPGTHNPIGPDDLTQLFRMDLIMQNLSQDIGIEIPEPVR
jgi:tryptophan synthase beta chain